MRLKLRKNRLKIANQTVHIRPMNAKDGLEAVIHFSSVMDQATPYLVLLAKRSRSVRFMALGRLLKEVDGIPDVIFEVVALSTGLSRYELETEATLKEVFTAFAIILKLNDWSTFWGAAYSLRIVEDHTIVGWAMSSLQRLTARG